MTGQPGPAVDPDVFKGVLGSWVSGVCVVTARHEGLVYGLTVSSFSSLSVDPLLVLVCIQNSNHMARMVPESRSFAVSLLAEGQEEIAQHFAVSGREPLPAFEGIETADWVTGCPTMKGALAHLDCELEDAFPGGDHTIVVGRIVHADFEADLKPLTYYRRAYRTLVLD